MLIYSDKLKSSIFSHHNSIKKKDTVRETQEAYAKTNENGYYRKSMRMKWGNGKGSVYVCACVSMCVHTYTHNHRHKHTGMHTAQAQTHSCTLTQVTHGCQSLEAMYLEFLRRGLSLGAGADN